MYSPERIEASNVGSTNRPSEHVSRQAQELLTHHDSTINSSSQSAAGKKLELNNVLPTVHLDGMETSISNDPGKLIKKPADGGTKKPLDGGSTSWADDGQHGGKKQTDGGIKKPFDSGATSWSDEDGVKKPFKKDYAGFKKDFDPDKKFVKKPGFDKDFDLDGEDKVLKDKKPLADDDMGSTDGGKKKFFLNKPEAGDEGNGKKLTKPEGKVEIDMSKLEHYLAEAKKLGKPVDKQTYMELLKAEAMSRVKGK